MVSTGAAVGIAAGVVGGLLAVWHVGIWYEVDVKCEKPKYVLLKTLKSSSGTTVQIRRYAPNLIAQVTLKDIAMRDAIGSGFRQIAGFIFGKNIAPGSDASSSIAMTSPVTMEVTKPRTDTTSSKVAMTSPVTMEVGTNAGEYKVAFIMPSQYTKETLPKPINDNVEIIEMPARTFAAMGWRGGSPSEATMMKKGNELAAALKEAGIKTRGSLHEWQYHPPFAPAWMRKNEVLYEVEDEDSATATS